MFEIHEQHFWQLVDGLVIASMHLKVDNTIAWSRVRASITETLHKHGVHNMTLQPEFIAVRRGRRGAGAVPSLACRCWQGWRGKSSGTHLTHQARIARSPRRRCRPSAARHGRGRGPGRVYRRGQLRDGLPGRALLSEAHLCRGEAAVRLRRPCVVVHLRWGLSARERCMTLGGGGLCGGA